MATLLDDPLFALVSRVTCDPFITFRVKAPNVSSCGYREISGADDSNAWTTAMFSALSDVFGEREHGFVKMTATSLAFKLGGIVSSLSPAG